LEERIREEPEGSRGGEKKNSEEPHKSKGLTLKV